MCNKKLVVSNKHTNGIQIYLKLICIYYNAIYIPLTVKMRGGDTGQFPYALRFKI